MKNNTASALAVVKAYLGSASIANDVAGLKADDINLARLHDIYGEWIQSFSLPPLETGETRPFMVSNYGKHEVVVNVIGSYDPVDVYRSGSETVTELLEGRMGPRGENWAASNIPRLVERIKLHCLYAHSVALEYPWSIESVAGYKESALKFMRLCSALEPLLDSGVLHLVPSLEDLDLPTDAGFGTPGWHIIHEAIDLLSADRLSGNTDPLGELDGAYLEALRYGDSDWLTESAMRNARVHSYLAPLLFEMIASTRLSAMDVYMTRREVPLLRRLFQMANDEYHRFGGLRTRKVDDILAFCSLLELSVPTGNLTLTDIVELRKGSEFDIFRQGLRRGLAAIDSRPFDEYLDPNSVKLAEIRREIVEARKAMGQELKRSNFLKRHLNESGDLLIAAAAGAAGAYATEPAIGAGVGLGTYFGARLAAWLKARSQAESTAFIRHLTIFDSQDKVHR
jgi:hypothetical protein